MSKFNQKTTVSQKLQKHPQISTSHEGGTLFKGEKEKELYLQACTMIFNDKFYEDSLAAQIRFRDQIRNCDRDFVLKLANYARNAMHLRSAPVMMLAEASTMFSNDAQESKVDVRQYAPKILRRADEPMEVLSYWIKNLGSGNKMGLPNALKKGIADAIGQFDEYQLAKYNRKGDVTLRDVFRLVHPKADSAERNDLYRRVIEGNLATPETWEVAMSAAGQTGKSKTETWNEMAPKMGILALLRNLRNFEEANAQEAIKVAINTFTNRDHVLKSRILPFRWYEARKHVTSSKLKDALGVALNHSCANVPKLDGSVAIIIDSSGSMSSGMTGKSTSYHEIAAVMGAIAGHCIKPGEDYMVGHFGDRFATIDISINDSVMTNVNKVVSKNGNVGHGTNINQAMDHLLRATKKYDHVFVFSDMQIASGYGHYSYTSGSFADAWNRYVSQNPKATLYSFDLTGYNQGSLTPTGFKNTYALAGWSERVFEFVDKVSKADDAVSLIKRDW